MGDSKPPRISTVVAGIVPAIDRSGVLGQVAGTSPAMTVGWTVGWTVAV